MIILNFTLYRHHNSCFLIDILTKEESIKFPIDATKYYLT